MLLQSRYVEYMLNYSRVVNIMDVLFCSHFTKVQELKSSELLLLAL